MLILEPTQLIAALCIGMLLDFIFGEVRRWHPLVGFGTYANFIERHANHFSQNLYFGKTSGCIAWLLTVQPAVIGLAFLLLLLPDFLFPNLVPLQVDFTTFVHALILYFCLGLRSLRDHTIPIYLALTGGDLKEARRLTSYIVSRDTSQASEEDIAKASVESLLENGCDAVFGTLFWFCVGGGIGALLYRLANTLDAMWGYRTPRFVYFGWAAARIDDGLNFIPARLTAIGYALLGNTKLAFICWRTQAAQWSSPNAGPVMATGAGALALSLGGAAVYNGQVEQRPLLGLGRTAIATDILRAWRLVRNLSFCCVGLAIVCGFIIQWVHHA